MELSVRPKDCNVEYLRLENDSTRLDILAYMEIRPRWRICRL